MEQFTNMMQYIWHPMARAFLTSKASIRVIVTGNQAGKCLQKGSLIQLFSGELVEIENIHPGDDVISMDENNSCKLKSSKVLSVIDSGVQECYEIKTASGLSLSATGVHPFFTPDGWVELKNLPVGGIIAKTDIPHNGVLWDTITSITPAGQQQTYDLEIQHTHNFIANGLIAHNTATAMMDLSMRMLGIHPVPERNYLPHTVRCVSKSLPKSNEDEENAQYVEFKRFFPNSMIKRDVNGRDKFVMVECGSGDTNKVEFFSKNMDLDAFMSVQRSAYYQDEEIDKVKWDESLVRLLRDGGDIVLTLTPVKGLDWVYDEIWMKAKTIYRSDTICKACNLPAVEHRNGGRDIEVFCWATDDNPILKTDDVDRIMEAIGVSEDDDDDQKMMRRYGVFRQISGRIYKNFLTEIHRISYDKYWDEDAFRYFWHYRMIDYHPSKPWYVSFVAVSPTHEWYIWNELKLQHDRATTIDLRDTIKHTSLIDEDDMYNRRTIPNKFIRIPKAIIKPINKFSATTEKANPIPMMDAWRPKAIDRTNITLNFP